jgi:hypothetical protein
MRLRRLLVGRLRWTSVSLLGLNLALPATAQAAPDHPKSAFFLEVSAGPAYSRYRPVDSASDIPEHRVVEASLYGVGSGYGIELGGGRLDLGVRVSHLHLDVAGSYDLDRNDDGFRANYEFIAPAAVGRFETRFASRVDLYAGLTLGTAVLLSDRQGAAPHSELIPIFGALEAGFTLRVTDWLDGRAGVSWLPPVDQLRMLSPQLGLRTRL